MNRKKSFISLFLTVFVIGLILLSGPASAIDVSISGLENIDVSDSSLETFDVVVTVNDGEFLPLRFTNLIFSEGGDTITCKVNNDLTNDCDFLTVNSMNVNSLDSGYGYGYGYGYNSDNNFGYHDFGYGYGYGTNGVIGGSGSGTVTYSVSIDPSKLPSQFFDETVNVEARVYGGTEDNSNYFKGSSTFGISASQADTFVTSTAQTSLTYGDVTLDIPANSLPADTTVTIKQVTPTEIPTGDISLVGKVIDFGPDGTTFADPVTIKLTYTDEELSLAGVTEDDLSPYYYDGSNWIVISGFTIDKTANTITFTINHFTQFSILADTSTPATPNPGNPSSNNPTILIPVEEEDFEITPVDETPVDKEDVEEDDKGMEGIAGAAITGNILTRNPIASVIVVALVVIFGLIAYFEVLKKKKRYY